MRFETSADAALFAESIRGVLAGWEAPREPPLGEWWDERDDVLAARLRQAGWDELWSGPELLEPATAGAMELGRVVAPVCLVDEATLGASLAVAGRVRHGGGADAAAWLEGGRVLLGTPAARAGEPSLDGSGTLLAGGAGRPLADGEARVRVWSAATLGYLAGLAAAALRATVAHAQAREQFGAPLAALPAIQARLADATLLADGLALVAWEAASSEDRDPALRGPALLWAGRAARDVTASAHQVHGAVGFALESGVHRAYRRAKSVEAWTRAVVGAQG